MVKSGLKILILEDVKFDVELIVRHLKKSGYIFTARNVFTKEDYIQELKDFNPDLIISDHSMPQFTSVDALNIFKKYKLNIPFILVTGAVSEEFAVKMLKEGADDYILKGNLIRLPSAIENAFRQKKAEQEKVMAVEDLKKSEEYFRSLIENATDIIKVLNPDFTIKYISPSVERILGYKPKELTGKNILKYIHRDDHEFLLKGFSNKRIDFKEIHKAEYRFMHKEGYWCEIETFGKLYSEKPGEESIIVNCRDISDRKQAERKLQFKIKELDTLIYMYSHDLKGPFCSLQGFINIAKMDVSDEKALGYIEKIENTTKKLDAILMNLVQITMINRELINITKIDFENILNDILESYKDLIINRKPAVRVKVDVALKNEFFSDPKLIKSILDNLIHNSLIYIRKNGVPPEITIHVFEKNPDQVRISIKDKGIGIPYQIQDDIFDMFFRGSYESKGSGLGLYIVKNAVEKLNGTINLNSEVGKGTEFQVDLPHSE
jgi:PAS domain S-box-containing protein